MTKNINRGAFDMWEKEMEVLVQRKMQTLPPRDYFTFGEIAKIIGVDEHSVLYAYAKGSLKVIEYGEQRRKLVLKEEVVRIIKEKFDYLKQPECLDLLQRCGINVKRHAFNYYWKASITKPIAFRGQGSSKSIHYKTFLGIVEELESVRELRDKKGLEHNEVVRYLDIKLSEPEKKWNINTWKTELGALIEDIVEHIVLSKERFGVRELAVFLNIGSIWNAMDAARNEGLIKIESTKEYEREFIPRIEFIRIVREKLSYLGQDQVVELIKKSSVDIHPRTFYKHFWRKAPHRKIVILGRGEKIHFSEFLKILEMLKKVRKRKRINEATISEKYLRRKYLKETLRNVASRYLDYKMSQPIKDWNVDNWESELKVVISKSIMNKLPSNKSEFTDSEASKILCMVRGNLKRRGKIKFLKDNPNLIRAEEITKILEERSSTLDFNQALNLLQKHGLYIGKDDLKKNFWKQTNRIGIVHPGKLGFGLRIQYGEFIDIVKRLLKERIEKDDLIDTAALAKNLGIARKTLTIMACREGIELVYKRLFPTERTTTRPPSYLKATDAQRLSSLFTDYISKKEYVQIFRNEGLVGKRDVVLRVGKTNLSDEITIRQLLNQHNLFVQTSRGNVVSRDKLASLIADLKSSQYQERNKIWINLQKIDYSLFERIPERLKDLNPKDEEMLWMLSYREDKTAFKHLCTLYWPAFVANAIKFYQWIPVEDKIKWGQFGLWQAIVRHFEVKRAYPSLKNFAIAKIKFAILKASREESIILPKGSKRISFESPAFKESGRMRSIRTYHEIISAKDILYEGGLTYDEFVGDKDEENNNSDDIY